MESGKGKWSSIGKKESRTWRGTWTECEKDRESQKWSRVRNSNPRSWTDKVPAECDVSISNMTSFQAPSVLKGPAAEEVGFCPAGRAQVRQQGYLQMSTSSLDTRKWNAVGWKCHHYEAQFRYLDVEGLSALLTDPLFASNWLHISFLEACISCCCLSPPLVHLLPSFSIYLPSLFCLPWSTDDTTEQ